MQQFAQPDIKGNIKAPYRWPFVKGIHWWFPSQRASNAESVSISWHHHDPRTPLVLMMAWWLFGTEPFWEQMLVMVNWCPVNKFQWNLSIEENVFENVICKVVATLWQPQCIMIEIWNSYVDDCIADTLEILQSCTKPSMCPEQPCLSHWGRDEMDNISQTTFSNVFYAMKMFEFRLKFHWCLFPRVQFTKFQPWFR